MRTEMTAPSRLSTQNVSGSVQLPVFRYRTPSDGIFRPVHMPARNGGIPVRLRKAYGLRRDVVPERPVQRGPDAQEHGDVDRAASEGVVRPVGEAQGEEKEWVAPRPRLELVAVADVQALVDDDALAELDPACMGGAKVSIVVPAHPGDFPYPGFVAEAVQGARVRGGKGRVSSIDNVTVQDEVVPVRQAVQEGEERVDPAEGRAKMHVADDDGLHVRPPMSLIASRRNDSKALAGFGKGKAHDRCQQPCGCRHLQIEVAQRVEGHGRSSQEPARSGAVRSGTRAREPSLLRTRACRSMARWSENISSGTRPGREDAPMIPYSSRSCTQSECTS